MKNESKKSALILLLITVFAVSAIGQPMQGPPGHGKAPLQMMEKLNLTEKQEEQLQDLRFDMEAKMIGLKADLQTERLKLRKMKQADEVNKKKLYAQIEKVGAVKIKMEKTRTDHQLAMRKVLTDEQFETFRRGMQHRPGHFGNKGMYCQDRGPRQYFQHRF